MENASKALIIAGAILLAILIISLGLMVYNQAKETVGSVNLGQQEIEAFNAKFTSFEGNRISGSQVNALIQTILSSNQAELNERSGLYITAKFPDINGSNANITVNTNAFTQKRSGTMKVTPGKTYKVVLNYSNVSAVNNIVITSN